MANVSVTNSFTANTTAVAAEVNTNFTDLVDYLNARDNGTAAWQFMNVTATDAAPVTISSNQVTTLVQINNSATDGDPVLEWALSDVVQFSMGVDDGDSDKLKIGTTAIGSSTLFELDASGSSPTLVIKNSQSTTDLQIDNTASDGDPTLSFALSGTTIFTMGVDDSATDNFKIGTTALATATMFNADSSGAILKPLQPSFLATDGTTQTDVTGDGTEATVIYGTEIFDQNADFASNTFTAPVTGRYYLSAMVVLAGYVADNTATQLKIVTSNRSYLKETPDIGASTILSVSLSTFADMDANDTATVTVKVTGTTKEIDIGLDATETTFSGSLIN